MRHPPAKGRGLLAALPPLAALGAAAWLLAPELARGFTATGDVLGLDQRDFRVFDNFQGPEANDNTTPAPQFPGYTGAVLAIWKAHVEWQSALHGTGDGDPSQPGDLGSGGGAYDPTFQGRASEVGGTNSNTHSAISGGGGGVLSYVEFPTSDGWRVRYVEGNGCFDDGPGVVIAPGCIDLQGLATHEIGHVIGLGHSSVPGATMAPTLSGSGVAQRSIEADDAAGVQFVYGAAGPAKPRITAVTITSGLVQIFGTGFAPAGNEVWFTQRGAGGDGEPIRATGYPSQLGGTRIDIPLPVLAGPGDVLVKIPGASFQTLSNAHPLDPGFPPCLPPEVTCVAAPNSVSPAGARIGSAGTPSLEGNAFTLTARGAPPGRFAIFYYGPGAAQVPFGEGVRCVAGPFTRLPVLQIDPQGEARQPLDLTAPPGPAGPLVPGARYLFQLWYRDPAGGPAGFNLSDALAVVLCT